jgi:hypothetical protein
MGVLADGGPTPDTFGVGSQHKKSFDALAAEVLASLQHRVEPSFA